jgi:hypothetical protein
MPKKTPMSETPREDEDVWERLAAAAASLREVRLQVQKKWEQDEHSRRVAEGQHLTLIEGGQSALGGEDA